jgi:predicted ATPase with chaperone activity
MMASCAWPGRWVADLEGSDAIQQGHVVEAINYLSLDRKLWAK